MESGDKTSVATDEVVYVLCMNTWIDSTASYAAEVPQPLAIAAMTDSWQTGISSYDVHSWYSGRQNTACTCTTMYNCTRNKPFDAGSMRLYRLATVIVSCIHVAKLLCRSIDTNKTCDSVVSTCVFNMHM